MDILKIKKSVTKNLNLLFLSLFLACILIISFSGFIIAPAGSGGNITKIILGGLK